MRRCRCRRGRCRPRARWLSVRRRLQIRQDVFAVCHGIQHIPDALLMGLCLSGIPHPPWRAGEAWRSRRWWRWQVPHHVHGLFIADAAALVRARVGVRCIPAATASVISPWRGVYLRDRDCLRPRVRLHRARAGVRVRVLELCACFRAACGCLCACFGGAWGC